MKTTGNRKKGLQKRSRRSANTGRGGKWWASPHPPPFVAVPWYNLVVRIEDPPTNVTTAILQQSLANQLNLTFANGTLDVRIQGVRMWGALVTMNATTAVAPLSVIIFDPIATAQAAGTGTGPRILEQLVDYPDQVSRACIGYRYPLAQREFSLRIVGTGGTPSTLVTATGLGPRSVMYWYLQWRSTTLFPALEKLMNDTKLSSEPIYESLNENSEDEIEVLPLPRRRNATLNSRKSSSH